eukprot:2098961-Amphidinium_carterae.3
MSTKIPCNGTSRTTSMDSCLRHDRCQRCRQRKADRTIKHENHNAENPFDGTLSTTSMDPMCPK